MTFQTWWRLILDSDSHFINYSFQLSQLFMLTINQLFIYVIIKLKPWPLMEFKKTTFEIWWHLRCSIESVYNASDFSFYYSTFCCCFRFVCFECAPSLFRWFVSGDTLKMNECKTVTLPNHNVNDPSAWISSTYSFIIRSVTISMIIQ